MVRGHASLAVHFRFTVLGSGVFKKDLNTPPHKSSQRAGSLEVETDIDTSEASAVTSADVDFVDATRKMEDAAQHRMGRDDSGTSLEIDVPVCKQVMESLGLLVRAVDGIADVSAVNSNFPVMF